MQNITFLIKPFKNIYPFYLIYYIGLYLFLFAYVIIEYNNSEPSDSKATTLAMLIFCVILETIDFSFCVNIKF